jgi:hypothetical protein
MSERCLAKTCKGYQCSNNSANGYLTCNIRSHVDQLYQTKNINLQKGGG